MINARYASGNGLIVQSVAIGNGNRGIIGRMAAKTPPVFLFIKNRVHFPHAGGEILLFKLSRNGGSAGGTLLLDGLGDLFHFRRRSARADGIGENMHLRKAAGADEVQRLFKLLLRLSRESNDQIRCDGGVFEIYI